MIKVAITGGIGSGKSTLCQAFATVKVPIYNADKEAKRLMSESKDLRQAIIQEFGQQSYCDTEPNREYLSSVVFGDAQALKRLNSIVHPAVKRDFGMWCMMHSEQYPYVIMESAILFESGFDKEVDVIVAVLAPQELRIQRTCLRDGVSEEQVRARINAQLSEQELAQRADYTVVNIIEGEMEGAAQRLDQIFKHRATTQS